MKGSERRRCPPFRLAAMRWRRRGDFRAFAAIAVREVDFGGNSGAIARIGVPDRQHPQCVL
jgi:hypothetical protein